MTMKTPGQIAAEQMLNAMEIVPLDDASMAFWTEQLIAAIEADRAQQGGIAAAVASVLRDRGAITAAEWIAAGDGDENMDEFWEVYAGPMLDRIEAEHSTSPTTDEPTKHGAGLDYSNLDRLLSAWDAYDGDVSGFYDAWIDHINDGTELPTWAGGDQS